MRSTNLLLLLLLLEDGADLRKDLKKRPLSERGWCQT